MKQRVGYVPGCCIYRWMRIREAIAFVKSFYPTWNDDLCDELLDLFDLAVDKKVSQLSIRGWSPNYRCCWRFRTSRNYSF